MKVSKKVSGVEYAIPIDKMQSFLEKHRNLFEKLAAEFVKKIQN